MLESLFQPLFDRTGSAHDAAALVTPNAHWTYGRLGAEILRFLTLLRDLPDGTMLIHGHKEPEAVAAMLAAIWMGRAYVFADAANPASRMDSIARTASARFALAVGPELPDLAIPTLSSREIAPAQAGTPRGFGPMPSVRGDSLLCLTMTSGSTGTPKGVQISRDNFASFLSWFGPLCDGCAGRGGGHVNHASFAFDMSASDLWPTLCGGRPVYLLDHRNNINARATLRQLSRDIGASEAGPGSWTSTPAFLSMTLADPSFCARELPRLRTFFVGGEQVNRGALALLHERFPDAELLHGYGPSEATCITHCHALSQDQLVGDGPLPLGTAQGGMTVRILDETGKDLAPGLVGEIELIGPQVSPGYLPALHPGNGSAFTGAPSTPNRRAYRTGDYGWVDADGGLFVEGRRDGQIKWKGNRIERGEIERVAMECAAVENAVLLIDRDEDNQVRSLRLVVQSSRRLSGLDADVATHLKTRLPPSFCPRAVHVVDALPLTQAGKVDRQRLAHLLACEPIR
jgi:D-alanine--poly(phosphoribitol) ligase subunit 1